MAKVKSKLAEIKTRETTASVEDFINSVPDEQKRKDSFVILKVLPPEEKLIGFSSDSPRVKQTCHCISQ